MEEKRNKKNALDSLRDFVSSSLNSVQSFTAPRIQQAQKNVKSTINRNVDLKPLKGGGSYLTIKNPTAVKTIRSAQQQLQKAQKGATKVSQALEGNPITRTPAKLARETLEAGKDFVLAEPSNDAIKQYMKFIGKGTGAVASTAGTTALAYRPAQLVLGGTIGTASKAIENMSSGKSAFTDLDKGVEKGIENAWILPLTSAVTDKFVKGIAPKLLSDNVDDAFKVAKNLTGQRKAQAIYIGIKNNMMRGLAETPAEIMGFAAWDTLKENKNFLEAVVDNTLPTLIGNAAFFGGKSVIKGANAATDQVQKEIFNSIKQAFTSPQAQRGEISLEPLAKLLGIKDKPEPELKKIQLLPTGNQPQKIEPLVELANKYQSYPEFVKHLRDTQELGTAKRVLAGQGFEDLSDFYKKAVRGRIQADGTTALPNFTPIPRDTAKPVPLKTMVQGDLNEYDVAADIVRSRKKITPTDRQAAENTILNLADRYLTKAQIDKAKGEPRALAVLLQKVAKNSDQTTKIPQEAYGALAGIEMTTDEEGNPTVRYNPTKGLLGLGVMAGVKNIRGSDIGADALVKEARKYSSADEFDADLARSGRDISKQLKEIYPDKNYFDALTELVGGRLPKQPLDYSEVKVFHGSDKKFSEIDPSLSNTSSKTGVGKGHIFYTTDKEVAQSYGKNIIEDTIKPKKPLVVDAEGLPWNDIKYDGKSYNINELAKLAEKKGYKSLIVENLRDTGGKQAADIPGGFKQSTTIAVFDKGNKQQLKDLSKTTSPDLNYTPLKSAGGGDIPDGVGTPPRGSDVPVGAKTKPRKFVKRVSEEVDLPQPLKDGIKDLKPKDYVIAPNKQATAKVDNVIKQKGIAGLNDVINQRGELNEVKSAGYIRAIEIAEQNKDWDRAIDLYDQYDRELREAGRFVQAASLRSRQSPEVFLRWAEKQVAKTNERYGLADNIMGREPVELTQAEKQDIFARMAEIKQMPDGQDKVNATLELIDSIAKKVPPSVSEMIDAYRYQNMLSGPKTQMRNIWANMAQTLIYRPWELGTRGGVDWMRSTMTGADRQAYVNDVPVYYKNLINAVPNATEAFKEAWNYRPAEIDGGRDLGIDVDDAFSAARTKQMPSGLTFISRFMEASDRFNSSLIAAGEYAIRTKNGEAPEVAEAGAKQLAQKYLFRAELDPSDPDLSYMSKVLASTGNFITNLRRMPYIGKPAGWFIPFVRTPINVGIEMIERTPPLAAFRPKMSDEATAKIINGTMVMSVGAVMALQGRTTWTPPTGEKEKAWWYATGRKPFSVQVGDTWVPAWYFGPYAMALMLPAAAKYYHEDSKTALTDSAAEKLFNVAQSTIRFISSQTSVQGLGNFFALLEGDADYTLPSQIGFTVGQTIPFQSAIRWINQGLDPIYRKGSGVTDTILKDIPGFSQDIEPILGPLGEPVQRAPGNLWLPYDVGRENDVYDAAYPAIQAESRLSSIESRINTIKRQAEAGQMSLDEAGKELIDLVRARNKLMQQMQESTEELEQDTAPREQSNAGSTEKKQAAVRITRKGRKPAKPKTPKLTLRGSRSKSKSPTVRITRGQTPRVERYLSGTGGLEIGSPIS